MIFCGVVANFLDCDIVVNEFKSSLAITLTFRWIPLGEVLVSNPLVIRWYNYFCPWNRDSVAGRVIPKTQKMALDILLIKTQHYTVRFKGSGAIQGIEYLGLVSIEKGGFGSPSTIVANFDFYVLFFYKYSFDIT